MKITVNGREMEVVDGLSVEALLTHLAVKREYTAVGGEPRDHAKGVVCLGGAARR